MSSKFFERRAVRVQMKNYLESKGWTDINWAEGFSSFTIDEITVPFVAVILTDFGSQELEMGRNPKENKLFNRRLQAYVYMESEDRVDAITDDIADFMDLEPIVIKDNSNNILGSMISDTETIIVAEDAYDMAAPDSIQWAAVIGCMYEAFYPQG